jgi:hypothetical protein
VIIKTSTGYVVKSSIGKNMSKPTLSKAAAEHRLKQVEWFKTKGRIEHGEISAKPKTKRLFGLDAK